MEVNRFRPLAGFWFLKFVRVRHISSHCRFPSPCGVLVLKGANAAAKVAKAQGFRPLAGFWFLKMKTDEKRRILFESFRPLAGFWFLKTTACFRIFSACSFPSPCGVLVLKV